MRRHAEQVSYERSSQAQSFLVPPNLLTSAGYYLIFAGWRFQFAEKESLNQSKVPPMMPICSDLFQNLN
jgi:hypothetical protein